MKTVSEIEKYLDALYPKTLSESWDNDGIMLCLDRSKSVKRIAVCLDVTNDVIKKALFNNVDLIISHHPFIFSGEKNLDFTSEKKMFWPFLIKENVAVMSYHTRLDTAENGLNDWFSQLLQLQNTERFGLSEDVSLLGRVGNLKRESNIFEFCEFLKKSTGAHLRLYKSDNEIIKRVAVVTGGGKDYIRSAMKSGADVFVSGDLSYNASLDAATLGMNVVDLGHYETERIVTGLLKQRLLILDDELEIFELDSGENRVFWL